MIDSHSQKQSSSSCQENPFNYNADIIDEENNSDLLRNDNDKSIKNKMYAKNYR